jgi:putative heme-binding domain-containing protein
MLVVEDLDAYLADPSKYLAERPLEPLDPMLKTLRPRKEWTFEDLAPSLSELARGRSFASAKQVFQIANCTACHRMNGVGYEIGPDLAKLDPKISPEEILRSVVEPSAKIDPKYATSVLETESGRIVTGLVIEETDDVVKLVENPLVQSEPIVVPKQDIADRQVSKTSIMPLGMLDRLTREEALDLLAYLVARGDPADAVFSGQGGHGH